MKKFFMLFESFATKLSRLKVLHSIKCNYLFTRKKKIILFVILFILTKLIHALLLTIKAAQLIISSLKIIIFFWMSRLIISRENIRFDGFRSLHFKHILDFSNILQSHTNSITFKQRNYSQRLSGGNYFSVSLCLCMLLRNTNFVSQTMFAIARSLSSF